MAREANENEGFYYAGKFIIRSIIQDSLGGARDYSIGSHLQFGADVDVHTIRGELMSVIVSTIWTFSVNNDRRSADAAKALSYQGSSSFVDEVSKLLISPASFSQRPKSSPAISIPAILLFLSSM